LNKANSPQGSGGLRALKPRTSNAATTTDTASEPHAPRDQSGDN